MFLVVGLSSPGDRLELPDFASDLLQDFAPGSHCRSPESRGRGPEAGVRKPETGRQVQTAGLSYWLCSGILLREALAGVWSQESGGRSQGLYYMLFACLIMLMGSCVLQLL